MRCGAYTSGLPRKLGGPCDKILVQQRRQILNGRLPWPEGQHVPHPWPLTPDCPKRGEWWEQLYGR
eukprot:8786585-Pyramimonas_sp.AAC.1